MKGKKVLHIVSVSFSLQYFVGNQFHYFKQKGYEFHVACSESAEFAALSKEFGFKPFSIPILRSIDPLQDIKSIYKLYRYIRQENFDIVIAHSPKGGLIGMLASYLARTPKRVFFRHGLVFETVNGFKRQLLINIERLIGSCANLVVNVSPSITDISNKFRLNDKNKNTLLGKGTCNGIDLNRFQYRPKTNPHFILGYVGRLSRDKGIIELVDAWLHFEKDKQNVYLHLVGPLDERDVLPPDTVKKINESPSIRFFGSVKDTSTYYNEMDVFILPSYREGFGMVILEASASGLPIITTKSTGCINAIEENITGIYTKIETGDIASAIDYYFKNPHLREHHGKNGIMFVQNNFSEQRLFDEIEAKVLN